MEYAKILEQLTALGADVRGAMERFLDDEEMYVVCLHMFAEDKNFDRLGKALAEGDAKAGFEAAHTIKGVAANLGLTPIFNAACKLVEPLRAGNAEGLENDYKQLMALFSRFCELLPPKDAE